MVTTASDKAQLISQGQLLPPGCCALCGSGNSEIGYLDIRLYLDFYGQAYFCITCVEQFVRALEGLTYDEAQTLKVQHLNDQSTIAALRTEIEEYKHDLGELRAALTVIRSNFNIPSVLHSSGSPVVYESVTEIAGERTGEGADVTEVGSGEANTSQPEPPEPTTNVRPYKPSDITASDLGI